MSRFRPPLRYYTGPQDPHNIRHFEPGTLPDIYAIPLAPQDDGGLRWFGTPWSAEVNEEESQIPVPVGRCCPTCGVSFTATDSGYALPHFTRTDSMDRVYLQRYALHRSCFVVACEAIDIDAIS